MQTKLQNRQKHATAASLCQHAASSAAAGCKRNTDFMLASLEPVVMRMSACLAVCY